MQTETISNLKWAIQAKDQERQQIAQDVENFLKFGRNKITAVPGFTTANRPQSFEEKRLTFNNPLSGKPKKSSLTFRDVAQKFMARGSAE